jgi:hypothetical protein
VVSSNAWLIVVLAGSGCALDELDGVKTMIQTGIKFA